MQEHDEIQIKQVSEKMDDRALDMTEIRLLPSTTRGGAAHCTLWPGQTSLAGKHQTIEEIWYCVQGQGEVWLKHDSEERAEAVSSGICFTIPTGTHFQVRNISSEPLCFVLVTIPPWPGAQEWVKVGDHWPTE